MKKFTLGLATTLLGLTLAAPAGATPTLARADALPLVEKAPDARVPEIAGGSLFYQSAMQRGYLSVVSEDYEAAASFFEDALRAEPGNKYAEIAYTNVVEMLDETRTGIPDEGEMSDYDRYMDIGYEAARSDAYVFASLFFAKALGERPNDSYARQALENIQDYLSLGR